MAKKAEISGSTAPLTREMKIEYFAASIGIAGVRFDNPSIVELLVDIYDSVIANKGKVEVAHLLKMKAQWMAKNQPPQMQVKK